MKRSIGNRMFYFCIALVASSFVAYITRKYGKVGDFWFCMTVITFLCLNRDCFNVVYNVGDCSIKKAISYILAGTFFGFFYFLIFMPKELFLYMFIMILIGAFTGISFSEFILNNLFFKSKKTYKNKTPQDSFYEIGGDIGGMPS